MIKIPVSEPYIHPDDIKFVTEVLTKSEVSGRAPVVAEFEREFARYIGRKFAIACCNGTAALHLALKALSLSTPNEVLLPAFTMMSPVFAVMYEGARLRLVDSDKKYWTMDVDAVRKTIAKSTKCIMAVHIYGNSVPMDELCEIADERGIYVIEDAAEALGAQYKGRKVGSFGDISTFSFFANKLITCGEGGMVCTDDEEIAERIRSLRDLCFGKKNKFLHEGIGYNYRMSAIQAALGLSQLRRAEEHLSKIRAIARQYRQELEGLKGISLHEEPPFSVGSYWMYSIVLDNRSLRREEVMRALMRRGIETRPFFVPVHRQPICPEYIRSKRYPIAEYLSANGINLPSGLTLTEDKVQYVCESLKGILNGRFG